MVKSKILVIGSNNNTFNPVTSAPANSGKVEASFIVPPAWVLSDRLGVPRIENTPGPSMSCNETNGNCLIYGGHKLNQLEEVNRTDYDTVIVFLSQVSAEENDRQSLFFNDTDDQKIVSFLEEIHQTKKVITVMIAPGAVVTYKWA